MTKDGWRVEFLLQAVDEPSVVVTAEQLWHKQDAVLRRWVSRPEDVLLGDLGRAGRLYPALDRALSARRPVELELDVEGAYDFLQHAAELAEAGFGVMLPSWWRQPHRLGLRLTAASRGTAGQVAKESELGLKVLVDYKWELAVGDERLTEAELQSLAEAKVPLVRVRGQWVHVDPKRLAAGLAFLKRGGGQMTAAQVLLHSGLHPEDADLPLPLTGVSADRLARRPARPARSSEQLEPVEPPDGLVARAAPVPAARPGLARVPRPARPRRLPGRRHGPRQDRPAARAGGAATARTASGRRRCSSARCRWSATGSARPRASRPAWRCTSTTAPTAATLRRRAATWSLTTYALAARDAEAAGRRRSWDRVVLDEAQNIKNSSTRQAQAVRALPARHRVALTGTRWRTGWPSCGRSWTSLNPGLLGTDQHVPRPLRRPDRALRRRGRRRPPAPDHRPVRAAPAQDRPADHRRPAGQDRDQAAVHADRRAGHALPGRGRRDAGQDRARREGIERKGLVLADADPAQAGLQPPGAAARRRLARSPAAPASSPGSRRCSRKRSPTATRRCASPSSPSSARCCVPHLAARFGTEVAVPARRHAEAARATRWCERFQDDGRPADLRAVAEGGRHRPQPDRRQPRHPLRPLVEPGGRGPGDRPRVPHRPAPRRAGAQARLRRHGRGADRPDDRGEARAGRSSWSAPARTG